MLWYIQSQVYHVLQLTIPQSGMDKYDAKRAEQSASDEPRAHIRFGESSTERPDGAGEAISSSASASSVSSDSDELHKSEGQVCVFPPGHPLSQASRRSGTI